MTILSVVLAISAIGGFFLVRSAAINAAHDEVADQMLRRGDQLVGQRVDQYLGEQGNILIGDWLENNPAALKRALDLVNTTEEETVDTEEIINRMDENDTA
ncbi:MAG: hypothetical protein GEU95_17915 [Rhizobiales bacterium]|nr:hypothetical protein [Hyphomicrobiales bacterium]